jgi:endogenous inhibitor of DNA gyrase (YacG/DUF329 family)
VNARPAAPKWNGAKNKYRPFCSERCKQIDLGAWAEEKYTIPAVNLPLEDEDKPVQ